MQRLVLALGALFLRLLAGAARGDGDPSWLRALAWVFVAVSLWFAAAVAGAWTAVIWILPAAIVGFLAERFVGRDRVTRPLIEAATMVVLAQLSIPRLGIVATGVAAVVAAAVGMVVDRLVSRMPLRPRVIAVSAVVGLGVLALAAISARRETRAIAMLAPCLALATPPSGERVELASGAVAWFDAPSESAAGPAALLFHGNHPAGAKQKAAVALRRALSGASFRVLAVDHPGYGESPAPRPDAELADWNPSFTVVAAFDWLVARDDVTSIVAIGHSLGCDDVVRLLGAGRRPDRALLFGAGLPDGAALEEYWYDRFSRARGLETPLPLERYRAIRDSYYDIGLLIKQLPVDHPEITCGFFGSEHANIEQTRQELYDRIPGAKSIWRLEDSTHYFSTYQFAGIVIGDARVTRRLVERFAGLAVGH